MLEQLQGFHIEPTNICTLKCPRCARTEFINKSSHWKNQQLNLTHLKKFLDIDLKHKNFAICGVYGDPIYYNDLIELVTWIKEQNGKVQIVTNGSYKDKNWWQSLCSLLTKADSIYFAIDGIPENFTKYRVNADWQSIQIGIEQAVKNTTAIWKYIPFSFNENDIDKANKIATDLGMNFFIEPSDRWNSDSDPLKSSKFVGARYNHVIGWHTDSKSTVDARCKKNHSEHFISAAGQYLPCCFVADHRFFYQSDFYKNQTQYDISTTTISEILHKLENFYNSIETQQPKYCKFNCPKL